jgi:hypothetical protein
MHMLIMHLADNALIFAVTESVHIQIDHFYIIHTAWPFGVFMQEKNWKSIEAALTDSRDD